MIFHKLWKNRKTLFTFKLRRNFFQFDDFSQIMKKLWNFVYIWATQETSFYFDEFCSQKKNRETLFVFNLLQFDEFFHTKKNEKKKSSNFIYIQAAQNITPFNLTDFFIKKNMKKNNHHAQNILTIFFTFKLLRTQLLLTIFFHLQIYGLHLTYK